jgi:hypothetical protein
MRIGFGFRGADVVFVVDDEDSMRESLVAEKLGADR